MFEPCLSHRVPHRAMVNKLFEPCLRQRFLHGRNVFMHGGETCLYALGPKHVYAWTERLYLVVFVLMYWCYLLGHCSTIALIHFTHLRFMFASWNCRKTTVSYKFVSFFFLVRIFFICTHGFLYLWYYFIASSFFLLENTYF